MLSIIRDIVSKFSTFVFSFGGSILTITLYTIFGGFLFQSIEIEQEALTKIKVKNLTLTTVAIFKQYILQSWASNRTIKPWKMNEIFADYTQKVSMLKNEDGWNGKFGDLEYSWTIEGSILFSVTVVTTIGYGVITPKTRIGKFLTILYAIVGIPLTFVSLSNIGQHFSKAFVGGYLLIRDKLETKTKLLKNHKQNIDMKNEISELKIQPREINPRRVLSKLRYKWKYTNQYGPIVNWNHIDQDLCVYSLTSGRNSSIGTILELDQDTEECFIRNNSVNVSYVTYDRIIIEERIKPSDISYCQARIPIFITFTIMTCYILIGALFFTVWEEKDYLKWAYFCFITLSTIGFGDIVPGMSKTFDSNNMIDLGTKIDSKNPKEKLIFVIFYVVVGLSVFSMCFKLVEEEIRLKWHSFLRKIRK